MKDFASLKTPAIARVGETLSKVSTPALMLDLDAFESNLKFMADLTRHHGVALRPHAKAHKSTTISRQQMAMGAVGVCCQKLSEAYPFVRAGIDSIHISNEFVGADKVAMAVELAGLIKLSICVDHVAQVDAVGKAATAAGVVISVMPEVDVGHGRCGVDSNEALAALVDRIAAYPGLQFGGLQAYNGGIQHLATWEQRRLEAARSADLVAQYIQFLEARGVTCAVVSGAGTGTVEFDVAAGVYTEMQPGSYIFLDGHYGSNEWAGDYTPRHGLFILSTIMSTAKPHKAVCDVGLKGVAVDSGLPRVRAGDYEDKLRYVSANDEHGILQVAADDMRDHLGNRVMLIPGHCDPTCNLYDQFVCFRGDVVEAIWEIDARGLSW